MLIAFYYLIIQNFKKKILIFIIITQLFSWIVEIEFLQITYASNNKCDNVEAISAKINLDILQGRFLQFINSRDKIKCWLNDLDSERSIKIINGEALK